MTIHNAGSLNIDDVFRTPAAQGDRSQPDFEAIFRGERAQSVHRPGQGRGSGPAHLAMNPAPMGPEVNDYPLEALSWLVVNEIEGRQLSGIDLEYIGGDQADEAVVNALRRRYPKAVVVVTLGKKGAIRADASDLIRSSFPDQGPIVDTFMGYWLAGEVSVLQKDFGLRRACAPGALAVTGIPMLSEVEDLLT